MEKSDPNIRPLRYTVSCGLLIHTCLILGLIIGGYFFWYVRLPLVEVEVIRKRQIVTIMDDWNKVLAEVKDETILELEPGKYVDGIITGRKHITIQSKDPKKLAELISTNNSALTWEKCTDCDMRNLLIVSQSAWPAVTLQSCTKIQLANLDIKATQVAIRDHQEDSKGTTIEHNKIQGRLQFKGCADLVVRSNQILYPADSAASFEDITSLVFEDNQILQTGNAITFKKIKRDINTEKVNRIVHNIFGDKKAPLNKGGIWIQDTIDDVWCLGNIISSKEGPAFQLSDTSNIQINHWNKKDIVVGANPAPNTPQPAPNTPQPAPNGNNPPNTAQTPQEQENLLKQQNVFRSHFHSQKGPAVVILRSSGITLANSIYENESSEDFALVLDNSTIQAMFNNNILGTPVVNKQGIREEINGGGIAIRNSTVALTNNTIQYCSNAGVYIENDSKVNFVGNQITDIEKEGIYAEKSIVEISLGNLINNCQKTGIYFKKIKGKIEGSKIYKNKRDGIFLEDSSPIIAKNLIFSNGVNGLTLDSKSIPQITGNDFSENEQYGIDLRGSTKMNWRDNIFFENKLGQSTDPTAKSNPAPTKTSATHLNSSTTPQTPNSTSPNNPNTQPSSTTNPDSQLPQKPAGAPPPAEVNKKPANATTFESDKKSANTTPENQNNWEENFNIWKDKQN